MLESHANLLRLAARERGVSRFLDHLNPRIWTS